ncbi:hypothetical protein LWI29_018823 [Acer saccharum]|uniref:Legume lectin domain-containing protein n=1 Tax=Acer saccharum TaxID=4024 RepID=A0AA39S5U7_ACESA|nr:hypothetical protein LWI29_018823 [Acer saccharum]
MRLKKSHQEVVDMEEQEEEQEEEEEEEEEEVMEEVGLEEAIQVTPDVGSLPITHKSGRAFYNRQFRLWKKRGTGVPENSDGQWVGIVNATTNGTSQANIVAIEFDTRKSYSQDLDGNHVGLDINSICSIKQVSLNSFGVNLSTGRVELLMLQIQDWKSSFQRKNGVCAYSGVGLLPSESAPEALHESCFTGSFRGSTPTAGAYRKAFFRVACHASIFQWVGSFPCRKPTYSIFRYLCQIR